MGKRSKMHSGNGGGNKGLLASTATGAASRRLLIAGAIGCLAGATLTFVSTRIVNHASAVSPATAAAVQMPFTLHNLLNLPPEQLGQADIALVNLLCAEGLPGAENLDVPKTLATLDQWAKHVKSETDRHLYKFRQNPKEYNHSDAYFRMLMLVTVLQQDLKVQYNAARILNPDFRNAKDLFIHGMIGDSNGGTCTSMPVLYIAVGRRLGYPLKLVAAKAHLFARWEDGKERFNIEGTNQGLNCFNDDYYKTWPFKLTDVELRGGYYLKSMTPAEELAAIMASRADCLETNGRLHEAQVAYAEAHRLAPLFKPYWSQLAVTVGKENPASLRAGPMYDPVYGDDLPSRNQPIGDVGAINRQSRRIMESQMRPPVPPSPHGSQGTGLQGTR